MPTKNSRKPRRVRIARDAASAVDANLPGIARKLYDAYPASDLLPFDPDVSCNTLRSLATATRGSGEALFSFLVNEVLDTLEGEKPENYAATVASTFNAIEKDVAAIRRVVERQVEEMEDRFKNVADAERDVVSVG